MKKLLVIFICGLVNNVFAKQNIDNNTLSNESNFVKNNSVSLLENKGQITDQYHNSRTDIQFSIGASSGLNIFIGNSGIHYQFNKVENSNKSISTDPINRHKKTNDFSYILYRMDVDLLGANKNAKIETGSKSDYFENYYTTSVDENGVRVFAYDKITYVDVYPNIDWIIYTQNGQLKNEFVVRNGGKVSDIKLKYSGVSELKLDDEGSLIAKTPMGEIKEYSPKSYLENGSKVTSNFKLVRDTISYELGEWEGTLIIDPVIGWATYFGGSSEDLPGGLAVDLIGDVYMTGNTQSISTIATTGAFQTTYGGGTYGDAFLVKFSNSGAKLWATYYGGNHDDYGTDLTIDKFGYIYMSGNTMSTYGIATSGAYQTAFGGGTYSGDAFLAKFNSAGARQWATYYGGDWDDQGHKLSSDSSGNIYMSGTTSSNTSIATSGAYQSTYGGGPSAGDAFLVKFNSAGIRLWATYYGGSEDDYGISVCTDHLGNVFLSGYTQSASGIATSGTYQPTFAGWWDTYLVKFDSSGNRIWATYYGGGQNDYGISVSTDTLGNVFISGNTNSTSGIASTSAYQTIFGGGYDIFLAKFNNSGILQWATYYGSSGYDYNGIVTNDIAGNSYVVGYTTSTTGMASAGAYQASLAGSFDACIVKFDSSGNRAWATYYGGSDYETGLSIVVNDSGYVFFDGWTASTSGIATTGSYQTTYGGGSRDVYLAKFHDCSLPNVSDIIGLDSVCVGSTVTLSDTSGSGVWSSSTSSIATIGVTGIVNPVSIGVDTISYSITNTCGTSLVKTNLQVITTSSPGTISGIDTVCVGNSITLSESIVGGYWSSSNSSASVTSVGIVNGLSVGIDTINYNMTNSCGVSSTHFPVIIRPASSCLSKINEAESSLISPMKIFPNPNEGSFTINLNGENSALMLLTVKNIVGQKIKEYTFVDKKTIDISLNEPPGLYFITLITAQGSWCEKLEIR